MNRKPVILFLSLLLILSIVGVAISEKPVGKITISITGSKDCDFDHTAHEKTVGDCIKCHHKDEKGKEQKCTVCHTKEGKDGATKAKTAFHKQCIGCHKTSTPKVPSGCKTCHP